MKLKEADGTASQDTNSGSGVKTGHIQNSSMTTSKIAGGAVMDAKITGPIATGGNIQVENVKIKGATSGIRQTNGANNITVKNTEISVGISVTAGSVKGAHSQVIGTVSGNVRLVNCYDENYNPLPNQ